LILLNQILTFEIAHFIITNIRLRNVLQYP
jgi:hypothetical protein